MLTLFNPESIAVVGASADLERVSGLPIKYLQKHEYGGAIYPVNPNHDEIAGLECYPDVRDVPTTPDLAVIALPARLVVDVAEDALDTGVENVLIISSGFSETGDDANVAAEQELAALADRYDANVVGPNSQGVINFREHVAASFTPALKRSDPPTGNVSFVTQSGAFGGALTTMLQDSEVGMYKWVATGNEADLESLDFICEMAADDGTDVAAGYLEGFKDGRKLIELKRTDDGIDLLIVAIKVGRSERGQTAAASHTGKIATSHRVYESVFRETGVIGVDEIDLFRDVAKTASLDRPLPGKRVGVMTTSGGAGVHIADVADEVGLELPALDGETRERIEEYIPSYGSALNPVDLTAQVVNSTEAFRECLRLLLADEQIDSVILQITNASGEGAVEYAELVADVVADHDTPLFLSWAGGVDRAEGTQIYREAEIPVFENPARCVQTIAALEQFAASRSRLRESQHLPARPPEPDDTDAPDLLTEVEGKELLAAHGIDVPRERLVTDGADAREAAAEFGSPVVAKLVAPEIQHRNHVGAVRTDVDESEVETVTEELLTIGDREGADVDGVTVQEQIEGDLELSLGINLDPDFGPLLMLGRGGVDIESVDDATFRTIPVSRPQAAAMLEDLETVDESSLSAGQRAAVLDAAVGLSACYMDEPWIKEADVNPLIVTDDGAVAVDALFVGPDSTD